MAVSRVARQIDATDCANVTDADIQKIPGLSGKVREIETWNGLGKAWQRRRRATGIDQSPEASMK
jgi:hypothetical protein